MIIDILISVIFFFILMYVSVNLLGLLIRGLFINQELDKLKQNNHKFIKKEVEKSQEADKVINIVVFILMLAYFYVLFHIWNVGVLISAILIMIGRLPDLLWEIRHGRKTDSSLMKKNILYYLSAFLPWLALPLLYFSLY